MKLKWMLAGVIVSSSLAGCDFLRGYAEGHSTSLQPYEEQDLTIAQLGAARLAFDDFGALSTDTLQAEAMPWKLVAAALVLKHFPAQAATRKHLQEVLQAYGLLVAERVANWPLPEQPVFRTPLGVVSGRVQRDLPHIDVEVANLGCASCHAGVTYDSHGMPQKSVWLGLPNTSLDLDAYFDDVRDALRSGLRAKESVFVAVKQLFPDVTEAEIATLRDRIWPALPQRLAFGGPRYRSGGPGRANGIAALEAQVLLKAGVSQSAASMSIPAIGNLGLRWSVLADGLLTRKGEPRFQPRSAIEAAAPSRAAPMIAYFSLPALGLHPDASVSATDAFGDVLTFLANYETPPFPGAIDAAAATRGAVVYARCAECHGEYVERNGRLTLRSFPNRLSAGSEMTTDSARLDAVNGALITAIEQSPARNSLEAAETRGYVAPSLAGIWATAPYLHNGSVPTLAALMTPAERPAKFWVGGHMLDFAKMGIAGQADATGEYMYPAGYQPWSRPSLFDTTEPGHSNRGHEKEFDGLSATDKADLIEFLKQL